MLGQMSRERLYRLAKTEIEEIINLPDAEAAAGLDDRIRAYDIVDALEKLSYAEFGQIACAFEARKLWSLIDNPKTEEPYESFEDWAASCPEASRSKIYAAKAIYKRGIEQGLTPEQMKGVPRENLKTLTKLSPAVCQKEDVQEAAHGSAEGFNTYLEKNEPNQIIEHHEPMKFNPTGSQRKVIEEAIHRAIASGAEDRDSALEYVAQAYIASSILEEAYAPGATIQ